MDHHPLQRRALLALILPALLGAAPATRSCPAIGTLDSGPLDAITDVDGVRVGQVTLAQGTRIHTGVTAILPHAGNLFRSRVPAGIAIANAFGKFAGSTQVAELGELETPVLLTNTLSVPEAMAASIEWTLAQPGNEAVQSVNAVVGETNDGQLNDIRGRHVAVADARRAIETARAGPVAQGAVGAGAGTIAFGYKAGIGTASRRLPAAQGGWTVGVLVQANYGGRLVMAGMAVDPPSAAEARPDGSVVIVLATDAPMADRNLTRLARRTFAGIARTGSAFSNGSGDYAIAFSTHPGVRRGAGNQAAPAREIANDAMTPFFQAAADATEAGVVHALLAARTVRGFRRSAPALPAAVVARLGCAHGP
jgi:D-aminopeptidase